MCPNIPNYVIIIEFECNQFFFKLGQLCLKARTPARATAAAPSSESGMTTAAARSSRGTRSSESPRSETSAARSGAQVRDLENFISTKIGCVIPTYDCKWLCDRGHATYYVSKLSALKMKGVYVRVSRIIRWMFKTMRQTSRSRTRLCNGFFGDWYYNAYRGGKGR